MVSCKEAYEKAQGYLEGINLVTEYENAYMFANEKGAMQIDGCDASIVVLKDDGRCMNMTAYLAEDLLTAEAGRRKT